MICTNVFDGAPGAAAAEIEPIRAHGTVTRRPGQRTTAGEARRRSRDYLVSLQARREGRFPTIDDSSR